MRKEIVTHASEHSSGDAWMDLESRAHVRLTSEDPARPIEGAVQNRPGFGWRAASPGPQTIWIGFDTPQTLREIHLRFEVAEQRTQEFVLLASTDGKRSYHEIVRQQFNFSPTTTIEDEHYFPHLSGVTELKLTIIPDVSGGDARATLRALRVR